MFVVCLCIISCAWSRKVAHGGSLTRSPGGAAVSSIALREIGLKIQSLFAVSLFFLAWLRRRLWPLCCLCPTNNRQTPLTNCAPSEKVTAQMTISKLKVEGEGGGRFRLSATRSTVERKTLFSRWMCGVWLCGGIHVV